MKYLFFFAIFFTILLTSFVFAASTCINPHPEYIVPPICMQWILPSEPCGSNECYEASVCEGDSITDNCNPQCLPKSCSLCCTLPCPNDGCPVPGASHILRDYLYNGDQSGNCNTGTCFFPCELRQETCNSGLDCTNSTYCGESLTCHVDHNKLPDPMRWDAWPLASENSYGSPTVDACTDGFDNDCDGLIDAEDTDDCGGGCGDPTGDKLIFETSSGNIAVLGSNGVMSISGTLITSASAAQLTESGGNDFIIENTAGTNIVKLEGDNGNLYIAGSFNPGGGALSPGASGNFVIENTNDDVVAYFDSSGNFYLMDCLNPEVADPQ